MEINDLICITFSQSAPHSTKKTLSISPLLSPVPFYIMLRCKCEKNSTGDPKCFKKIFAACNKKNVVATV